MIFCIYFYVGVMTLMILSGLRLCVYVCVDVAVELTIPRCVSRWCVSSLARDQTCFIWLLVFIHILIIIEVSFVCF